MKKYNQPESNVTLPNRAVPGKIGVVTVTYNSSSVLDDFLSSLNSQTYTNFVLVAVDSNSCDDSVSKLRNQIGCRTRVITCDTNIGIAAGNNLGIKSAIAEGCQFILLLNNDVVLSDDTLAELVRGIEEEHAAMTAPLIYFHHPPDIIWAAGGGFEPYMGFRNYHTGEGERDEGQYNQTRLIDFSPACCILIRREVFAEIGIFDENYFVYSDDADFMFRAMRRNIKTTYVPSARLWHKVSTLTGGLQSDFTIYQAARGRAIFLYKNLGKFSGRFWILATHFLYLVRPLLGKDTARRCSEKRRGLRDGWRIALSRYKQ